jgi:DNA end-binding protein Ku
VTKFDLSAYKDDYEAAVKKLVDAKRKGKPLPAPESEPAKAKVVNIMDALRNSLAEDKKPKKSASKTARRRKKVA